jgi:imidazolonepropionase-like amidohydrolase
MRFAIPISLLTCSWAFGQTLAITQAMVYPTASSEPIRNATVLLKGSTVIAVGSGIAIPKEATTLRCSGCVILPGFWNSHIHFIEPKWEGAATQPAAKLSRQLEEMLTQSGFTTVVDTASDLATSAALRSRIDRGEINGPRILTSGLPIFPPNGIPYYVKEALSPQLVRDMAPPADAAGAIAMVQKNINGGADLIKLFTASWIRPGAALPMPVEMAKAAVEEAHRHRRLVFAHPSSIAGLKVAIESRVDVLAHAPDDTRGIDARMIQSAVAQGMTLIPTLKLFTASPEIAEIRRIVNDYQKAGGRLVFGTDTGYLADYDVLEEYQELFNAGLTWRDVLRMLTASPVALFGDSSRIGGVAPGMAADITILGSDPSSGPEAFLNVKYTIRDGQVIWRQQ